jgi:branched-chain amino acid transport system permease protein
VNGTVGGVRDQAAAWLTRSDVRLLVGLTLGIYLLFIAFSVLLGLPFNGLVNTLKRITFLSAIYAMLVLALNIQWGYAGLFNIGVAGFMAVGVYAMAVLARAPTASPPGFGLPLALAIVGGVLVTTVVGALAALPALRLEADYLAIVTIAFSEIIRLSVKSPTFQNFTFQYTVDVPFSGASYDLAGPPLGTGGPQGLNLPANPIRIIFYQEPNSPASDLTGVGAAIIDIFDGIGVQETVVIGWVYTLVLVAFVGLFYWLLVRVSNSPFGRVLKAVREDELVASALGKDTSRFKIKAFALGCALTGVAAILWFVDRGFVSPGSFRPIQTFFVFVALIIGGSGSNTGSVVGGAVFASLLFEGPNFVKRVVGQTLQVGTVPDTILGAVGALGRLDPGPLLAYTVQDTNIAALRLVLLGAVLVYLVQNRPEGLLGHRKEEASGVDLSIRGGGEDG